MTRLTKDIRERMAVALVKHRYGEEGARLIAESQALFRAMYEHTHSQTVRNHMKAIQKEHPRAFGTDTNININLSGRRFQVGAQSIAKRWRVETAAVPTIGNFDNYPGVGMSNDTELGKRLEKFADDEKSLSDECEGAYKEALGTLQQFNSGKKLAEDWPEAMPVIGDLIPESDRTLPVVQTNQLNRKFKLPPKKG